MQIKNIILGLPFAHWPRPSMVQPAVLGRPKFNDGDGREPGPMKLQTCQAAPTRASCCAITGDPVGRVSQPETEIAIALRQETVVSESGQFAMDRPQSDALRHLA